MANIDDRIDILKRQALEASGGTTKTWESGALPPDVREQFWERVMAFENGPFTTDFERLTKAGIDLPEPASLEDEHLSGKLWEVINGLARLRVFLEQTDHLSDRELYDVLWRESLREEIPVEPDGPADPGSADHVNLVGTGSAEHIRAWLTYYADEQTREEWRRDYPEDDMPPHQDPPFDRGRHLPRPEA